MIENTFLRKEAQLSVPKHCMLFKMIARLCLQKRTYTDKNHKMLVWMKSISIVHAKLLKTKESDNNQCPLRR